MWLRKISPKQVKKITVKLAKKTAELEVNTACSLFNYQPKETEIIKRLRKF